MATSFVHQFISGDKDVPALLLLHGTGGSEKDLLGIGRSVAPHSALLSPRGQVLENGMPRFFRRLAEGVFDETDIQKRAGDLADFIQWARQEYALNQPLIALGYSNGANMAASLLLLHPEVLQGAVLLRAMVPLVPDPLPKLPNKPILLLSGKNDPLVPLSGTNRLAELLTQTGATVRLHALDTGHSLSAEDFALAAAWLGTQSGAR